MFNKIEKDIKFLHIIRPSQELSYPYIKMIQQEFDINDHFFLIYPRVPPEMCKCFMEFKNVKFFLDGKNTCLRMLDFFKLALRAENIIYHSLNLPNKYIWFYNIFTFFLKKIIWVAWGADLYGWKKTDKSIKSMVYNFLNYRIRKKIANFIAIFPPDADFFRKTIKSKATIYDCCYTSVDFKEVIEKTRPTVVKSGDKNVIKILVAHSANRWNNHFELLDSLTRYRNYAIKLYIPLSGGPDRRYARQVEQYAKKHFGYKAVCMMQPMPKEEYVKFLWDIDIAVFRLYQQGALGNIQRLLYMGKKVYLPSDSVMYQFFKEQGIDIYDSLELGAINFEKFTEPAKITEPPPYIIERTDKKRVVKKWREFFKKVRHEYN